MAELLFLGIIGLPLVLWMLWDRAGRRFYQGRAYVLNWFKGDSGRHAFVELEIPGLGYFLADIPVARLGSLKRGEDTLLEVEVSLVKRPLMRPSVVSIRWPGENAGENAQAVNGTALFVSVLYLLAGLAALVCQQPWAANILLIVSGFVAGTTIPDFQQPLPLGTRVALVIVAALTAVATLVLFSQMTIFTIFPGLAVSFGCGQALGMLVNRRR